MRGQGDTERGRLQRGAATEGSPYVRPPIPIPYPLSPIPLVTTYDFDTGHWSLIPEVRVGIQTLFVAAGHGGQDLGNIATGAVERDELVAIIGQMRTWFRRLGVAEGLGGVMFVADELDLVGEVQAISKWGPVAADGDLGVDVHLDYKPNKRNGGALVLYDETPYALEFAQRFLARWCAATGIANNGAYDHLRAAKEWRGWPDGFGFCRPRWPGVIIELGCLSCPDDMHIVRNPYFRILAGQLMYNVWREVTARGIGDGG